MLLSVNEVDASCPRMAHGLRHHARHAGRGTKTMQEEVYDVGDRLCEIRYAYTPLAVS
jgi:hypothetical protein